MRYSRPNMKLVKEAFEEKRLAEGMQLASGVVYFIQAGNKGPVKIGFTNHPNQVIPRMKMLQVGNHEKLRVIRVIKGKLGQTEGWLHRHFKDRRIRGEWFAYHDDMLTVIPPNPSIPYLKGAERSELEMWARAKEAQELGLANAKTLAAQPKRFLY